MDGESAPAVRHSLWNADFQKQVLSALTVREEHEGLIR